MEAAASEGDIRSLSTSSEWIPFVWPAEWREAAQLDALKDTGFNCLILPLEKEGAGSQAALRDAARSKGFACLIDSPDGASLSDGTLRVPVMDTTQIRPGAPGLLVLKDGVWPGIGQAASGGGDAGPTGMPWVDSNAWRMRLANVRAPKSRIWVRFAASKENQRVPTLAQYQAALADVAVYGGQWPVELDADLAKRLAAADTRAVEMLQQIGKSAVWLAKPRAWSSYQPLASLGVLSSYEGDDEYLATEMLNLAHRRQLAYRVLDLLQPATISYDNLLTVAVLTARKPANEVVEKLAGFLRGGGELIGPLGCDAWFGAEGAAAGPIDGYQQWKAGKGKLFAPVEEWSDPYLVAVDVHRIVGRRRDFAVVYNAGGALTYVSEAPSGSSGACQVVSYVSGFPRSGGGPVSLRVRRKIQSARLWSLGSDAARELKVVNIEGNQEIHVPELAAYSAIEFT